MIIDQNPGSTNQDDTSSQENEDSVEDGEDEKEDALPSFEPPLKSRVQVTLIKKEAKSETVVFGTLVDPDGDEFSAEVTTPSQLKGNIEASISSSGEWSIKVDYDPSVSSSSEISTGAYEF